MSHRPIDLLIADMLESIQKIERYTTGLDRAAFLGDEKTTDSVVRNLEIIGEAANRIPASFAARHPEIHWRRIVGLRNHIVRTIPGWTWRLSGKSCNTNCPR